MCRSHSRREKEDVQLIKPCECRHLLGDVYIEEGREQRFVRKGDNGLRIFFTKMRKTLEILAAMVLQEEKNKRL